MSVFLLKYTTSFLPSHYLPHYAEIQPITNILKVDGDACIAHSCHCHVDYTR